MTDKLNVSGFFDALRQGWFLIAFAAGVIYWVARQDSALVDIEQAMARISALESRATILETGIGQLQLKIDGIKEDLNLIKSAVMK